MPVSKKKRRAKSGSSAALGSQKVVPETAASSQPAAPTATPAATLAETIAAATRAADVPGLEPARQAMAEERWRDGFLAYGAFLSTHQDHHAARLEALQAAAEAVRRGAKFPRPPLPARAVRPLMISVIVCSIDDAKHAAVTAMYQRLLEDWPHEIISIRDARSLCEAYTRATAQAKGEVLVFSHDDVEFLTPDFAQRLHGHLRHFDVVGLAGTTRLAGPSWIQGGWSVARGQVTTIDRDGGDFRVDVYGVSGTAEAGIQAIDGFCIACRREVAEKIGFDAAAFDGFHLYDTDFTYRAHRAGYRLGVASDLPVIHRSTGRLDEAWARYAERFVAKFPDQGFTGRFGDNPLRATLLQTREQVVTFCDAMIALAQACPGAMAPAETEQPAAAPAAQAPTQSPTMPAAEPKIRIAMPWTLTEAHGWGLVGVHTALYLLDVGNPPLLLSPPMLSTMRPETRARLQPAVEEFRQIEGWLKENASVTMRLKDIDVMHPLGNALTEDPAGTRFVGRRNIGVIAFENTKLDAEAVRRGKAYDFIITHSSYNVRLLREAGLPDVRLAFQGIDETDMVRLTPRKVFGNRFVVFSGGKLEFRKGQDLVVEAFKRFHARHPDALLVSAWHNPWPQLSMDIAEAPHCTVAPTIADNRLRITRWVVDNGLPPEAFLDLGFLSRPQIPAVLAECSAALFPNRCEGGTNLVAMEAMACGVPCVISANTGHMDIIQDGNCYPLTRQGAVPDPRGDRVGWGESSVDEIVERLEEVYADAAEAKRRAEKAAAFIRSERTWRKFAEVFVAEALR